MSEIAAAVAAIFSSHTTINALLLVADALIYFAVLAALFRARHRIGIGAFFCALGVMHFLETHLASIVYVVLPFGRPRPARRCCSPADEARIRPSTVVHDRQFSLAAQGFALDYCVHTYDINRARPLAQNGG
jgi:hypothetical protein